MRDCRIRVPATTSNLGPGFDCFGMAVSLHLDVEVRSAEKLTVSSEGESVPLDRRNLVVATLLDALGPGKEPPLALHLKSHVPIARGLGSSATARVAGLALAELWRRSGSLEVDRAWVAEKATALEGHPDNATAAVYGGFCISAGGSHERIEMDAREYLALIPAVEIHTEAARAALPRQVPLTDAVYNLQRAALSAARLARERTLGALVPFEDRLHQRQRLALEPRLERAFLELQRLDGVDAAFLSGSGPTVLVLARDLDALAAGALEAFRAQGLPAEARRVRADNTGLSISGL